MNKQDLLREVWSTCTFDEIIDAGFEMQKCNASHILTAAKDFEDLDYLIHVVEHMKLDEIMNALKEEHSLREIISEFDCDDVMDCLDDDEMIDHLDGTYAMNRRDDEMKDEGYDEGYEDGLKDGEDSNMTEAGWLNALRNSDINRLMRFFCDMFGVSYYDNESLYSKFNELFADFENSFYKKDNKVWELTQK